MFDEGGGGGLEGEALQLSRGVWGAARPPNISPVTRFENLPSKNRLPGFEIYPITWFFMGCCCQVLSEWPVRWLINCELGQALGHV